MTRLVYDTPESVKKLEKFIYENIKKGESNKRILEIAKYRFYQEMTAVKIEEVVNKILKEKL